MRIDASIAGRAIALSDWSLSWRVNLGCDQFRATIPADDARALRQGDAVRVYYEGGPAWGGTLSIAPAIRADGRAEIAASGYGYEAERRSERRLYQSQDLTIWTESGSDPHVDTSGTPVYPNHKKVATPDQLRWRLDRQVALAVDQQSGWLFWAQGQQLTQVKARVIKSDTNANMQLRLMRGTGPTGALTQVTTWSMGTGTPSGTEITASISTPEDMVAFLLRVATAHTPADVEKYQLTNVRVYGLTTSDTLTGNQVAANVASALGWTSTTADTDTTNMLPLDWDNGTWADLLSMIAARVDRHWFVDAERRFHWRAWGNETWTVYSRDADLELAPEPVYNRAVVRYETPMGVPLTVTVHANPDPLSGTGQINALEASLPDPQPNATLASAYANALISQFSRQRYSGSMTIGAAYGASGANRPYAVRPGHTVRIADWAPGRDQTLRVVSVEHRSGGTITLELEGGLSSEAVLAQLPRVVPVPIGGMNIRPRPRQR